MRTYSQQKAALTRAVKSGDAGKVEAECRRVVKEWELAGTWPDEWARWQRALDDATWQREREARCNGWRPGSRCLADVRLEDMV